MLLGFKLVMLFHDHTFSFWFKLLLGLLRFAHQQNLELWTFCQPQGKAADHSNTETEPAACCPQSSTITCLWPPFAPASSRGYFQLEHLCAICDASGEASSHHHTFNKQHIALASQPSADNSCETKGPSSVVVVWFEVGILCSSWVFDSWALFPSLTGSAEKNI